MKFTHSLLFAVTTLFASSALAQDYWAAAESDDAHETYRPGGPRGKMGKGPKGPMPHELLRMHADQLNLSEDVLNEVEAVVSRVKESQRALRRDLKKLKADLHYEMDQEEPNRSKVMSLIQASGELKIKQQQARTSVLLDIRALLTPEQRRAMRQLMKERRKEMRGGKRGKRGGRF